MISRTLHILEQRVTMNEETTQSVNEYFRDAKKRQNAANKQALYYNPDAMLASLKEEHHERLRLQQLREEQAF